MSAIRIDSLAELPFWKNSSVTRPGPAQSIGKLNSFHVVVNDTTSSGHVNPVPDRIGFRVPAPLGDWAQKLRVPAELASIPKLLTKMGPTKPESVASIAS